MIWQLVNDRQGTIGQAIISRGGRNTNPVNNNTLPINNTTPNPINNTTGANNDTNNSSTINNGTTNNNGDGNTTTNTSNTTTNGNTSNSTTGNNNSTNNTSTTPVVPMPSTSSLILSMFYCGFGKDFCGQSTTDDVQSKASIVILAFANILANGSIEVDNNNFPTNLQLSWRASGKKILISVGGQNVDWDTAFTNSQNTNNFISSVVDVVNRYNLDGVDLNI